MTLSTDTTDQIALIFLLLILAVAFREYFEKGEWQGYVIFAMVAYLDICQMAHIALERFSLLGLMKRQRTLRQKPCRCSTSTLISAKIPSQFRS